MNRDDFITISIRGRVAFAICCFENALKHFNYNIGDWKILLEQLWAYTNIEFFDDWHYAMAEFIPESILEFSYFKEENFEYINEDQFILLQKLYNISNTSIKDIIKMIFDIGISEFYGRLENYGQKTLGHLEELMNYMTCNNIPLPDITKFKSLSYSENNGWGSKFIATQYSNIL